jgi:uncharacterized protein YwgA
MAPRAIDTKDLILLLLFAGDRQPIRGRTRLVKMVFLFKKEVAKHFRKPTGLAASTLPDFEPHNFGPFAPGVYADLEFLVDNGFVKHKEAGEAISEDEAEEYEYWQSTSGADGDAQFSQQDFTITDLGAKFVEAGHAGGALKKEQWQLLNDFKARCTAVSLKQLLRYVYSKYPDMTTRSTIVDEIL